MSNNQRNYTNEDTVLLSIINNNVGIVVDLYGIVFKYIKRVQIMKKAISIFENDSDVDDIQKIISSYIACADCIKHKLFGDNKNIFNDLMINHKCTMAAILDDNLPNDVVPIDIKESIIYVPDLFPTTDSNPIGYDFIAAMTNDIISIDSCSEFVIKNPICFELQKCVTKNITWQIYKCDHPILNLLLSDGYIQCGVMEHGDYYFTGFLRHCPDIKLTSDQAGRSGNGCLLRHNYKKKITLITPKNRGVINCKPLNIIINEFIVTMQNIKDNFGMTTDIPYYEILRNDDVDKFIEDCCIKYMGNNDRTIIRVPKIETERENNWYTKYVAAFNNNIPDAETQIFEYIRMNYYSKIQRERYNLNFRVIEFLT